MSSRHRNLTYRMFQDIMQYFFVETNNTVTGKQTLRTMFDIKYKKYLS